MAVDVRRLEGLTLYQLNELLEDEEQLQGMALEMEEAQNVQLSKEMTLASNRSLAEDNLLYQPKLDSQKAHLTQKYQELQLLFEAYQIKKTKLDKQSSNASLETLLALLQTEGAKIEEDTENMAEKFLDGEVSLDSFIDEYQSKRKLAHLRRVKIEKLQEMVLKGQRLPQVQVQPQPRALETTPAPQTSYSSDANTPLSVLPRRTPPQPPPSVPAGRFPTPFTAAMGSGPALPYSGVPCPPLPPRVGIQSAGQMPQPGYPSQFVSQYPPALPQRPPPRLPPHPGFILQ
ncbi:vacuolar protein sorting-associated protein 37B [Emydura macquarii macquarii]|uniref:vacuolar protein sorting-associated protein 37B n=1 Tax=Emydura macquarii macquarii TaxID=1129001 RepID=UPI00352B5EC4